MPAPRNDWIELRLALSKDALKMKAMPHSAVDLLQFPGHEQHVIAALDDAWAGDQKKILLQIQLEVRNGVAHFRFAA